MAGTDGQRGGARAGAAPWWLLAVLLLLAGLAGASPALAKGPEARAPGASDGVARTRAVFDDAFVSLRARIPAEAARAGHPLHGLHALLAFQRERVGWLRMTATQYVSDSKGDLRSWMVVVPQEHPYRRGMRSSLEMTAEEDFFVVHIAEAEYHPAWAMLFAIHEVTHLHDRDTGIEPLDPSRREFLDAELRAYRNELLVAELLSDGAFVRTMDAMLDEWAPTSMREVDTRANALADEDAARLSRAIDHADARSSAEDGLRRGFFWIALVMRHADRTGLGDEAVREVLARRMPWSDVDAKLMK